MEYNYFDDANSNGVANEGFKGNNGQVRDSMRDSTGSLSSGLSHRSTGSRDTTGTDAPLADNNAVGLKKQVGLVSGMSIIVGTMIGSGIFISPKGVTEGSGSVGLSLIIWTVCGIISALGALALAELGTLIPKSGGEYPYFMRGMGPQIGFLFSWTSVLLLKTSSVSIICLTCAEYIIVPIYNDDCGIPQSVVLKCTAMVILLLVGAINCYKVSFAARILVIFTASKIIALIIIIIGGIVRLGQGYTHNLSNGFGGTEGNVGKIAIGIYNGMWAYDGWNNLNYVTEEIVNPSRNLPLAIMIGIPLVTVLYVLVNVSYFTVMSATELLASPAVAITWAEAVIGPAAWLIPLAVAMSTFGAANGSLFASGRLPYAAAREGHMVEILSMVHIKRSTPLPSLVFTCIIALIMIIPGDIGSLIDFFSFAVWLFYGLTMATLLILRYTMKDEHRPYKVPLIAPIFVLLVSCYLVVAPIIEEPQIEYLYAFLFIIAGLIFYFPFVHFQKVLPGMDKFTLFMQLIMEVVPPTDETEI